jgi:hypothetical protein
MPILCPELSVKDCIRPARDQDGNGKQEDCAVLPGAYAGLLC